MKRAPCSGCPSEERCGRLQLACLAFEAWIDTETSRWWGTKCRRPNRAIYLRLFGAPSLTHGSQLEQSK